MKQANVEKLIAMEREVLAKHNCPNIIAIDHSYISRQRPDCSFDGKHYVKPPFQTYVTTLVGNALEQWKRRLCKKNG